MTATIRSLPKEDWRIECVRRFVSSQTPSLYKLCGVGPNP